MGHIFFRIYAGIVAAVVFGFLIAGLAISYSYKENAIQETKEVSRGTVRLILAELKDLSITEKVSWFEQNEPGFGFPISMAPWYKQLFTTGENEALASGDLVVKHDPVLKETDIYALIPATENLLKLGPISDEFERFNLTFFMSITLALLIIGFTVFFLVHPIELRLRSLENTAEKFAHGDLNIRCNVSGTDAVGQLEESFNYMADRIQSLIRAQQELTNAVSHELRTPIARLRFGLEMVTMATTHDEQEERLQGMDNDLTDLDTLIDELLTYARLGAAGPQISFQSINIEEMFEKVCDNLRSIYPHIDYQWSRAEDAPEHVQAEPLYLQRAIHNLVSNASRYAKSQVHCTYVVSDDESHIHVDDDGHGIPKDERERVFSPFTRLDDSRTRKTGGYGLGLAIVRRIVRWHKGRASVDRSHLGGARFIITWPRRLGQ